MKYKLLEVVVLERDLPDHGLRKDDLGTVVELYAPDQVEVEFVNAAGHTEALVTLGTDAIRPVSHHDLIAVRHVRRTAQDRKSFPERRECFLTVLLRNLRAHRHQKTEQFVGQELMASERFFDDPRLFYWHREARNANAEVDYVISAGAEVLPVEVKAARGGALKAMFQFLVDKHRHKAIRLYTGPASVESLSLPGMPSERVSLLSLPLFLAGQVRRLAAEFCEPTSLPEHQCQVISRNPRPRVVDAACVACSEILQADGVIPADLADRLQAMATFRNLLLAIERKAIAL